MSLARQRRIGCNCEVTADELARSLQDGAIPPDSAFDQFLPLELRDISSRHWTPLQVVVLASRWLEAAGARTVVDIGSGAGKFCVLSALLGGGTFVGLERRPRLVAVARRLARTFAVQGRVRFHEATLGQAAIPLADAYYLFNPFAENIYGPEQRIDHDVDHGKTRYHRDVELIHRLLDEVRPGTLVLTYHGFGGQVPPAFECIAIERTLPGVLRLWKKKESPE